MAKDTNVLFYIIAQLRKGRPHHEIKAELAKKGYDSNVIESLFRHPNVVNEIKRSRFIKGLEKEAGLLEGLKKSFEPKDILIILIIIAVIAGGVYAFLNRERLFQTQTEQPASIPSLLSDWDLSKQGEYFVFSKSFDVSAFTKPVLLIEYSNNVRAIKDITLLITLNLLSHPNFESIQPNENVKLKASYDIFMGDTKTLNSTSELELTKESLYETYLDVEVGNSQDFGIDTFGILKEKSVSTNEAVFKYDMYQSELGEDVDGEQIPIDKLRVFELSVNGDPYNVYVSLKPVTKNISLDKGDVSVQIKILFWNLEKTEFHKIAIEES